MSPAARKELESSGELDTTCTMERRAGLEILLCSHWFYPSVGGVEMVSRLLANEFVRAGASVTVVTHTPAEPGDRTEFNYPVMRRPAIKDLLAAGRRSDVIFQNHISLQTLLPLALLRKPAVLTHSSWLRTSQGKLNWQNRLKLLMLRSASNIAISKPIAEALPVPTKIIPNPFELDEFLPNRDTAKTRDIVFVGRLVSDKGCDLLLRALGLLRSRFGLQPTTTIIGGGPDVAELKALATELQLNDFVEFLGPIQEGRGRLVAQHRIQVVPSKWREPFGIVGLEGVASGCAMLVSADGGLPEAVGSCGLLFPNGDVEALAVQLKRLLEDDALRTQLTAGGLAHIERFRPENIAAEYLRHFEAVIADR